MEQGRFTEEKMKQPQDHRRLKPSENQLLQHHHPQQPQKCPRCDSLNTKFCYYNNYSLSQPRYFCKACRRYWTRGGTLRNVPIGGGSRKGKRSKVSSSSISQPLQPPLPLPAPHAHQMPQNLSTKGLGILGIPSMTSYYTGGGFLSSLAAMQTLSPPQIPFAQPLNIGGQFGSSSSLALLQGLNLPSCSSQVQNQQIQKQNEFYQMGYQSFMQQNRPVGSWNQSLINSSPTNSRGSLNRNQWPDLP